METKFNNFKSEALEKIKEHKANRRRKKELKNRKISNCEKILNTPLINAKYIALFLAGGAAASAATGLAQPDDGNQIKSRATSTALGSIIIGALIQNVSKSKEAKTFGQGLMAAGAFKIIESKT